MHFGGESHFFIDAHVSDCNPNQYIDIAQKAKDLKDLMAGSTESQEFYDGLTEFIKNCGADIQISNNVVGKSTKDEYFKAEEIISSIIGEIDSNWSIKQKLAYTHYKMGEIISYLPDCAFRGRFANAKESKDSRNIWRALVNGESVCDGIVDIQRNILSRLGIETTALHSKSHDYLLTKTEEGNIITDPTWDLSNSCFGARPNYFGRTYEELRKDDEPLSNAHKLETPPEDVISISEQELREIYHSIGLTNEDRTFPLPILGEVEKINEQGYKTSDEKYAALFEMFSQKFPEKSRHLSESRSILKSAFVNLGLDGKEIISEFVYSLDDEEFSNPLLVFHNNSEKSKRVVKILGKKDGSFTTMDLEEFDKKYRLHRLDTLEPFWKKYLPQKEEKQQEEKGDISLE